MKPILKKIGWTFLIILLLLSALGVFVVLPIKPKLNPISKLGVTFSPRAATFLGLDWKETYQALLNDLNPDIIRIPIYWNVLEKEKDNFNWEDFDYQLNALVGKDVQVILAIGHKLPRWPECHIPQWANDLTKNQIETQLFEMIEAIVNRYKNNPNLYAWQIQNEVLFAFGDCPSWSKDRSRLKKIIQQVKQLDPDHKVTTTDSGELSAWLKTSTLPIDTLGVSLYRAVYNEKHDYFYWPVNPYFYKLHALLVSPFVKEFFISELQMEPWGPDAVDKLSEAEIYKSFSPYDFSDRLDFAQRTGANVILGWGVEWWYYMKEVRGVNDYWNEAIKNFNK